MLAVLQDGAQHMTETVAAARIEGSTVEERMAQLIEVFSAHYARPDYLASLQVLLNMDHDPQTSSEVRKTMLEAAERSNVHVRRLLRDALGFRDGQARLGDHRLSRDSRFRIKPAVT